MKAKGARRKSSAKRSRREEALAAAVAPTAPAAPTGNRRRWLVVIAASVLPSALRRADPGGFMKRNVLVVLCIAFAFGLLGGCDATSGGLRAQPPSSPFPYNSPY
jgi:hypothetical protein